MSSCPRSACSFFAYIALCAATLLLSSPTATASLPPASGQFIQPPSLPAATPVVLPAASTVTGGPSTSSSQELSHIAHAQSLGSPAPRDEPWGQRAGSLSVVGSSSQPALAPAPTDHGGYVNQASLAAPPAPATKTSGLGGHQRAVILVGAFVSVVCIGSIVTCLVSLLCMARHEQRRARARQAGQGALGLIIPEVPSSTTGDKVDRDYKAVCHAPLYCTVVIQPDGMHDVGLVYEQPGKHAGK